MGVGIAISTVEILQRVCKSSTQTPQFLASFNTRCVKFSHSVLVFTREEELLCASFRRVGASNFQTNFNLWIRYWKGWFPLPMVSISRYKQIWLLKKCNKSYYRNCFACIILCEIHSELIKDYVFRSGSPIRDLGTQSWSLLKESNFLQSLLSGSVVACIFFVKCCKKVWKFEWGVIILKPFTLKCMCTLQTWTLTLSMRVCNKSLLAQNLTSTYEGKEEEEGKKVPKSRFHLHSYSSARES